MKRAGKHGLNRAVGAAAGSTLALALLVCGCVFTAMAGPALSLHTRSQALHQTLTGLPSTTKTVQVNTNWSDFIVALREAENQPGQDLDNRAFAQTTSEIARGLAAIPVPLAGGDWASLSTNPLGVTSGASASAQAGGGRPKMEVLYRDPFTSNARLVAGSYSDGTIPAGAVAVAATTQTAARFGLHPGSRLVLATPSGAVTIVVTAIVRERAAGSTFWTQDSTAAMPALQTPPHGGLPYWLGGVIADPDQLTAMQNAFYGPGMELQWEFPLAVGGVNANQAQQLRDDLNRATAVTPPLTGTLAAGANALTVTSPLISDLSLFLGTQAGIETVLLLLFVSLIVVGAAVILLAARMIVARRNGELTMLRARGGSLRQVAAVMARTAVIAGGPAAVIGAGLAIALTPGGAVSSSAGWSLAGIAILTALAGPPLVAAWQHRKPAPAGHPARITSAETGRTATAWRRPVAEVTACAASVAGLIVLHDQGLPAGGGTDLYLTIVPVLVAIPVVLVMLRLYPLAVRGLLATSARRAGATGFIALSRAAGSSLTGVLPAFALVLALSLATFAGGVSQGITRGEIAASWHTTGADVLIEAGPSSGPVGPAAVKAIAAVRGVRRATAVWNTNWVTPYGQPVTVVAVDPASYADVVAGTPFPAFPAGKIGPASGPVLAFGATVPVLASPSAAAILGGGATQLNSLSPMGPFKVRVAGTLSSTPAQPAGGAFVVMPLQTLPGPTGLPAPNMVLVTGSAIDDAQLSAVASKVIPGNTTTFRTAVLASLDSSPLQHGAALIIALTIAAAAAFGLFIVILGLALGSAERELTLARLTVMGHERPTRLVMTEAMPAVLAAVVAGAACAVALSQTIGSSIDLSAFTGTNAPVQFQPDVLAFGLPAAAIGVLAVAALVAEARALRRRGVTGMLRAN
jgi:putative ABC transport system permease protein